MGGRFVSGDGTARGRAKWPASRSGADPNSPKKVLRSPRRARHVLLPFCLKDF